MLVFAKLRCWMKIDPIASTEWVSRSVLFSLVHIEIGQMGSLGNRWSEQQVEEFEENLVNMNSISTMFVHIMKLMKWINVFDILLYIFNCGETRRNFFFLSVTLNFWAVYYLHLLFLSFSLCVYRISPFFYRVTSFYRINCSKITPDVKNHLFSFCVGD